MINNTDTELEDLEQYLVGLDEIGQGKLTSEWLTKSTFDSQSGKVELQSALTNLLEEAVILSKDEVYKFKT